MRLERPLELCDLGFPPKPLREQQRHGRAAQQRSVEIEDNDRVDGHSPRASAPPPDEQTREAASVGADIHAASIIPSYR